MAKLNIVYRKVTDLTPRTNNPRTHSAKQIDQIAGSIQRFGFTNPILIDGSDSVVAGHGRIEAAKRIANCPQMGRLPTFSYEGRFIRKPDLLEVVCLCQTWVSCCAKSRRTLTSSYQ